MVFQKRKAFKPFLRAANWISFGLIYLLGMEEVVVEASPFAEWEFPFVKYQFVMGIGEAYGVVLKVFKLPPVGWVLTIDC